VNGCEADSQVLAGEQHTEARDPEGIGKKLRLAGEAKPCGHELVLADRRGDHGGGLAIFEFVCGQFQCFECGGSGSLIWLTRDAGAAVADDFKFVVVRDFRRGKGLIDNFRADAGGVTECDEDAGHEVRFLCSHVLPSGNRRNFKSHGLHSDATESQHGAHTNESQYGPHTNKSLDEAPGAPEGYRRSAKSWAG